jgi:gliding motility-associated-like protein
VNYLIILLTLLTFKLFVPSLNAQENYNNCTNALELCPNVSSQVSNYSANKVSCSGCEDDFTSLACFSPENTIWLTFKTNSIGGDMQIDLTNIQYSAKANQTQNIHVALFQAKVACDASTYKSVGNCIFNGTTNEQISATNLPPNTTYYLVISGATNGPGTIAAEATMDISLSGVGANRLIPSITISPTKTNICKSETVGINCTLVNCNDSTSYNWYINDELVGKTDTNYFQTSALQDGDKIYVENTCFKSCKVTVIDSSSTFSVYSFIVDAGKDQTIEEGQTIALNGQTDGDIIHWEPVKNMVMDSTLNPLVNPKKDITYNLVSTKNNCTFSDDVYIKVRRKILTPVNSFSPNGDGINDTWLVPFLNEFPNCDLKIYDRWGQTVYEITGYSTNKAWDGKYKDKLVDEGVYFFVIELRDSFYPEPIKGTLTVVK